MTHDTYIAEVPSVPVWFNIHGLLITSLMVDTLHTVDLGVAAHIIGNVFWICIKRHAFGGTTQKENLSLLNKAIQEYYKRLKVKNKIQGLLTRDSIKTGKDWPKLKKHGGMVRHLAGFALELAIAHLDERVVMLCRCLTRFYHLG